MWKDFVNVINNMKIRNKLIISYVLLVMIPVIILGIAVTSYFRQMALNDAITQTVNNVEKINNQMYGRLKIPIDVSNKLYLDADLQSLVITEYKSMLEVFQAYKNYSEFQEFINLYSEIKDIRFYTNNNTMVNNLEFTYIDEEIRELDWYKEIVGSRGIGWFFVSQESSQPNQMLSLVRRIDFKESQDYGILVISMNQNVLNSILSQEQFETMIADDNGYIVAAKDPAIVGMTLDELDLGTNLLERGEHVLESNVNGVPSYIVVDTITPEFSLNGLKVISVFSTSSIVKDANRISWAGLILILIILAIALILVYVISKLFTQRLLHLSRQLSKVARGNFSVVSNIDGNDEIGQLSRQFNHMVRSINDLMNQVYETNEKNNKLEIAQKEIKLKMMASQINPHFLFNALESIRMKAHIKGEKEIANIVRLLGKLMRKNLEIGRGRTTIKEELEMVKSYLEIQKFRYEDRLNYEIFMDEKSEDVIIPPLIVQPLVENAIIHGLEGKEVNGLLCVRTRVIDDELQIEVTDNGIGMKPERMTEVIATLNAEDTEGARIGLRNVHQRIQLIYGYPYGLQIESVYGSGTNIHFKIPLGGDTYV